MLRKYASLEVAEILEVKGSRERVSKAGLDKLADYEDYRTGDGYLYTRVRAISSRVNKNHDGWPSEELAKAYRTFVGKPIFVDHNNSDPSRARGVIVDAKLHVDHEEKTSAHDPYYATAPENHKPPTWVELLLEVDAKAFPKLARAIIDDDIDGVSMGANVERSVCSHCANVATTPEEYCQHVMNKGATYDKYDAFGRKTAAPSYEDCYDIGFFEISYVFDPADETALDMGDKRHAIAKTAKTDAVRVMVNAPGTKWHGLTGSLLGKESMWEPAAPADYMRVQLDDGENMPFTQSELQIVREGKTAAPGGSMKPTNREKSIKPVPKPDKPKGPKQPTTEERKQQERELELEKNARCPECSGTGVTNNDMIKDEEGNDVFVEGRPCTRCGGSGMKDVAPGLRERQDSYNRLQAEEEAPFHGEGGETPAWAPEGGSLGDPNAPSDGAWDTDLKYWKHPDVSPSALPIPPKIETDRDPSLMPIDPTPVQPTPYREQVKDQAAEVPEEVRAERPPKVRPEEPLTPAKKEDRPYTPPNPRRPRKPKRYPDDRDYYLRNSKTDADAFINLVFGTMDMGGYGSGANAASGGPSAAGAQPALPGANDQNCPSCGAAMQDGVCPQCGVTPNEAPGGPADMAGASNPQGMMASFKLARDGTVHYSEYDEIEEARHYLRDIYAADPGSINLINGADPDMIMNSIDNTYSGGWKKFLSDLHVSQPFSYDPATQGMDDPIEGDDTMKRLEREKPYSGWGELDTEDVPLEGQALDDEHARILRNTEMLNNMKDETERKMDTPDPSLNLMDELNAAPPAPRDPTRTPQQMADEIVQTGNDPEGAVRKLQGMAGLDFDTALRYIEDAEARFRDTRESNVKIAKDGTVHYADNPLPQSMMTTSPESVDTLRQEKVCEICGSDMDDGKCEVCNFEEPPEGFNNPDLEKAQAIAEQGAEAGGAPGAPPPGVMTPGETGGGAPGGGGPAPSGGPPPGAGGGMPLSNYQGPVTYTGSANTYYSGATQVVRNVTAGKIRHNEQPIIPPTKTVSDHPKTTTVVKEPTRLTQSNTTERHMTQRKIPTRGEVVAQMVKRGTNGVKTAEQAEKLLDASGFAPLLAASPASDPAEHHQNVDQVGGEVDNPEGGVTHENVEKVQDITGIPTMTWSDGKGDSLGQHAPVTPEAGDLGGPIGDALASVKTADGQSGIFGDPTAAEKQIDVNKPLQPEFTPGPDTQTFKSDPFHVGDPVTTEDSNEVGGPIGTPLSKGSRAAVVAHVLSALKVAEQMVAEGLESEENKFELAAQLEQETPEQLQVRRDMLSKTHTARRRVKSPRLPGLVNGGRTAATNHEVPDDNFEHDSLFR